jgi:hypothetical protein
MAIFKRNTARAASPRPTLKERASALLSRTANVLHVQFPVPKFVVKHRARKADRHIARLFAEWHKTVWAWGEADALMAVAPLGSEEQKRTEEASRRAYRRQSIARREVADYSEAHTLRGLQMRAIAWAFNYGNCGANLDARVAECLAAVEAHEPSSVSSCSPSRSRAT